MSDIWNLSALCRCCHLDGSFKSLEAPYMYKNETEVYSVMLKDALGVSILKPPENLSYSICDVCIYKLRETINFKMQILMCEEKFNEYLQNEQALNPSKEIKLEIEPGQYSDELEIILEPNGVIKHETQNDSDNSINNCGMDECSNDFKKVEIKEECDSEVLEKESCKTGTKKATTRKTRKCTKTRNAQKPKAKKTGEKLTKSLFPCAQCGQCFATALRRSRHAATHCAPPRPYACAACGERHRDIDRIYQHAATHGAAEVTCRFCDKNFRVKRTLQDHENGAHIRASLFICDVCNKEFTYRSTLRKHLLWHRGLNKKAFCDICGRGFNDKTNLRSHVDTVHLKLRRFKCDQCPKTFTANKHLKNHVLVVHKGEKPYACKLCPKAYSDYRAFTQHKLAHEEARVDETSPALRYQCKACPETFDHRGQFKAHVMRHNRDGSSPNICHVCGRGFSCKYSLNRHVANHSGLKLFSCDICQKAFTQKALVDRHKRNVHDPVKKEKTKCPICKSNVRDLEKHQQRHAVRPFSCEMCARSYPAKNALNRHVKQVHMGIYKHVCGMCNAKFKSQKTLDRHNARRHPATQHQYELGMPLEIELK